MYPERFAYDFLEIYDGLPSYKWGPKSTNSMDKFKENANYYNSYLFWRLVDIIREKLNNPRGRFGVNNFGFAGRKGYLTNRSSRLIAGDNAGSVQARNFAMPLVIPKVCAFGDLVRYGNNSPHFRICSLVQQLSRVEMLTEFPGLQGAPDIYRRAIGQPLR